MGESAVCPNCSVHPNAWLPAPFAGILNLSDEFRRMKVVLTSQADAPATEARDWLADELGMEECEEDWIAEEEEPLGVTATCLHDELKLRVYTKGHERSRGLLDVLRQTARAEGEAQPDQLATLAGQLPAVLPLSPRTAALTALPHSQAAWRRW